jgi:hypothetical protein
VTAAPAISPVLVGPSGQLSTPLVGNPLGFWEGLRLAYLTVRLGSRDASGVTYPETTHADVAQIIAAWSRVIQRDHRPSADAAGYRERWESYVAQLEGGLREGRPEARFADNRAFSSCSRSTWRAGCRHVPRSPTMGQVAESVKTTIEDAARTCAPPPGRGPHRDGGQGARRRGRGVRWRHLACDPDAVAGRGCAPRRS